MKTYFTASLTGKKDYEKNYQTIYSCLKKLNCKVRAGDIIKKSRKEIDSKNRQERLAFVKYLNRGISWCDVVVAEVSFPSTSVGYEISVALRKKKPVLALYFENKGDRPSALRAVSDFLKEEEITLLEYNFQNLESLLEGYLDFIKTRAMDKRFTILFSPKVLTQLDNVSKRKKISRAVYIRDLIKKDIEQE